MILCLQVKTSVSACVSVLNVMIMGETGGMCGQVKAQAVVIREKKKTEVKKAD